LQELEDGYEAWRIKLCDAEAPGNISILCEGQPVLLVASVDGLPKGSRWGFAFSCPNWALLPNPILA
jgi:hypothetical protein